MKSQKSLKVSQEIHSVMDEVLRQAFLPPPRQTAWEWAEENVVLSPKTGTFSPGKYRTRHTPHVRGILEAFQSPDVREIVLSFAAQTAKTLTETVCVAWAIANDPGNMLFVMPSEGMAKSFSKSRLQTVITDSPTVSGHIYGTKSFNLLEMEFDNCVIALTGSGSASNLASRPIRYLFLDEMDKYPKSLGDEGNPVTLAKERTKTFPNAKIMQSSTPTTDMGEITLAFNETDQRRWFCPCPKCGHEYIASWERVWFPEEGSDEERAEKVEVRCPECGFGVTNKERRQFLSRGHWKPTSTARDSSKIGFRISEFESCIGRPWSDLVMMFLSANRKSKNGYIEDLKTFVCSVLAEPWVNRSDTMREADFFLSFCCDYSQGTVPSYMDVVGLTAGIDTQDNGFYYVIRAWGGGEALESWLVDYGFCETFEELHRVLTAKYPAEDGSRMWDVSGCFMDAMGHRTPEVYNFCRGIGRAARVIPTKGEQTLNGGTPFSFSAVDRERSGKVLPGSLQLCRINTTHFKDWLDGKLHIGQDDLGAWHLPETVDHEYCLQMSSEYRDDNGKWVPRTAQARNHYWDCEVLALARASSMKLDRYRQPPPGGGEGEMGYNDERRRRLI